MTLTRRSFLAGSLTLAGAGLAPPRAPRAAPADLDFVSALDAARAIRSGQVSSVELTTRMLERIEQHNGRINAIVALAGDPVERARAADLARSRRDWRGPFHGVPCTIKDTFEVAGITTTAGSPALRSHVPARDAAVAARLRAAGMVILGKTNVPMFAADWQTFNAVYGQTNNPWDVTRTPGGSTGGGAAALAAGLTYLEPGSDLAGSIRIPAHFCGVYGHKPSLGVVPMRGHIPPPPGISASPPSTLPGAGLLARSAADLRAALEVLGGPDGDEARAWRWSLPPARGARLADYRIGYVLDDPRGPVAPEVGAVLAAAIEALRRAGARLTEGWPPGVNAEEQFDAYYTLLAARFTGPVREDQLPGFRQLADSQDGSYLARYARAVTASDAHMQTVERRRRVARGVWQAYFRTHDAFLLPTALVAAFPHDHVGTPLMRVLATPRGDRPYPDLCFWISFASLAGLPATTAPIGLTPAGLPVGIQIVGPYLEDATPIDLAGRLADVIGGYRPPPGF
ncbi:MAG TPA: amidase family protein [Candidatus Limnocylindria bacterium]|nr:amidase family protein [Candidatus Limnocylindria bacterium]